MQKKPTDTPAGERRRRKALALTGVLVLQALCVVFLVWDAAADLSGPGAEDPGGEDFHNLLEALVVMALLVSVAITANQIRLLRAEISYARSQMRIASGAFHDLLEEHFGAWGLTPAERDVALFSIKGLTNAEIAALRETREGTVKAQLNAIYAKAGVTGRPQLLGLFIEDLMAGPLPGVDNHG